MCEKYFAFVSNDLEFEDNISSLPPTFRCKASLNIRKPININKTLPKIPTKNVACALSKRGFNPQKNNRIRKDSRIKCPNTISGPAILPFFKDPETTSINMGPGVMAPDRAVIKDRETIPRNSSILDFLRKRRLLPHP